MKIEQPRYPIYLPSKGRYETRLTMKQLEWMQTPHHIVVEEQEYDQYAAVTDPKFGTILVVPRRYFEEYEVCDEHGLTKSTGPGPARNFAWDHSTETYGAKRHWVMDDNIRGFARFHRNQIVKCGNGVPFAAMEDFCDRYKNVAMAGPQYEMFAMVRKKYPPFAVNRRIFSCNLILNEIPMRWRGRFNDDVILSIDIMEAGWCTLLFYAFLQMKVQTMRVPGGMFDLYKDGTYEKSKMLVDLFPQYAKIVKRYGRVHHSVDYSPFKRNKLVPIEGDIPKREYACDLRYRESGELVGDTSTKLAPGKVHT